MLFLWQLVYMLQIFPPLLFPSLLSIGQSLWDGIIYQGMSWSLLYSLWFIVRGLFYGIVLALFFSALSIANKTVHKVYYMFISLFDPLPGIALLPLVILWFGVGEGAILFLIIHSVLWPLSRSILDGFATVPLIYVESGKNFGLRGFRLVKDIYITAALPHILSGLKTGWGRAWRALIAVEMIFGVSGAMGGIGWYIYISRYKLDTPGVFASVVLILIAGLIVEYGIFGYFEKKTIKKWGLLNDR